MLFFIKLVYPPPPHRLKWLPPHATHQKSCFFLHFKTAYSVRFEKIEWAVIPDRLVRIRHQTGRCFFLSIIQRQPPLFGTICEIMKTKSSNRGRRKFPLISVSIKLIYMLLIRIRIQPTAPDTWNAKPFDFVVSLPIIDIWRADLLFYWFHCFSFHFNVKWTNP